MINEEIMKKMKKGQEASLKAQHPKKPKTNPYINDQSGHYTHDRKHNLQHVE
jgi:hypothetical protein